jgi:hypothetical protein
MDAEQTIAEIEWVERIFALPDGRPPSPNDLSAANRRHEGGQAAPSAGPVVLQRQSLYK